MALLVLSVYSRDESKLCVAMCCLLLLVRFDKRLTEALAHTNWQGSLLLQSCWVFPCRPIMRCHKRLSNKQV